MGDGWGEGGAQQQAKQEHTQFAHTIHFICLAYVSTSFQCLLYVTAMYRVIRNDCWGFNNLSHTIHLR
jgi:hypothetical protein